MKKTEFIKYLESNGFAQKTIEKHIKYTEQFFKYVKTEDVQVTKPDVLDYLKYLKNNLQYQNDYRSRHLVSLKHYFSFLYKDKLITENPCMFLKIRGTKKKRVYKLYTIEELEQLFDNYYQFYVRNYDDSGKYWREHGKVLSKLTKERNALILSILINQGATTNEIRKIEIKDIDFIKATIKIRGGTILNDRILPLKASQIGLIMHFIQNIRPQFSEYQTTESERLFLLLPTPGKKKATKRDLHHHIFEILCRQLKSIDKQFLNIFQVRTSVITNWLKTENLRKAQYMAGHRHVSTTETFLPNNLDNLKEDINKMHPFNL